MTISPLAPGAFRSSNAANMLTSMRMSMDDLQRQLATGKKSETFGGLGAQRITSLDMRAKLSEVDGYRSTITTFQIRARQMDLNLNALGKMGDDVRSFTFLPRYNPDSTGKTEIQKYVKDRFSEAIDHLNLQVNGSYFFSGRRTDVRPVLDAQTILNGDAAGRAGVTQLISERKAADYGVAASAGRVTRAGAGTNATLTEDGTHPFGFKLTAASTTSAGISAALTAGPPANIAFNVTANPADGEQVRLELTMPDGSKQTVELTAKAAPLSPVASAGEFEIGVTPAATAANLRTALGLALDRESVTTLPSASAKAAADAFFAGSLNSPPLRVSGPPATATALVAGTAANTVIWYQGDDQAPSARMTQQARVDTSLTVGIGAQANEQGVRRLMASLSVFVTETYSAANPNDEGRFQAMSDRLRSSLGPISGQQSVKDIQIEIAMSATTMNMADERHKTKINFLQTAVSDVEDVNQEETAAKLLSLQTKMQAAYQTTAIISRLNLTDYLR
jgi:flagellar hook-associated protein 3 FlgL